MEAGTQNKGKGQKDQKAPETPEELRTRLGLSPAATDAEVREAVKADRFKNVAGRRLNEVLDKLDLLANTGNRGNYSYTDEQVDTILSALADKYQKVRASFTEQPKAEKQRIQL